MRTVTDSGAAGPFPTGRVSFSADGAATPFASCSLSGSGVTQSCSVSYTPTTAGAHSIVAKYAGDSAHADSTSPPAAVDATKHPTATALVCDPSVPVSSAANCMATVTDSVATAPFPTGLVNFFAMIRPPPRSTLFPYTTLFRSSCSVSYTPTTAGAHSIVAKYAGDSAHADSTSPPAAVAATKHPTATGLVCDPSVPVSSAPNCIATVTDSAATSPFPTGPVDFFADGAATPFASCSLSGSGVTQSCSVSYTPTTTTPHSIVTMYARIPAHADSNSPPAAVAATKHPT